MNSGVPVRLILVKQYGREQLIEHDWNQNNLVIVMKVSYSGKGVTVTVKRRHRDRSTSGGALQIGPSGQVAPENEKLRAGRGMQVSQTWVRPGL
jgi:hypothetical protein